MKHFVYIILLWSSFPIVSVHAQSEADLRAQILMGNNIQVQAINYARTGDYDKAIELEEEALAIFRKIKIKEYQTYIGSALNNMATFYHSRGKSSDYIHAESYAEESLKYEKKGSEKYVDRLNQLVVYYTATGHVVKANALSKQLFKLGKNVYGQNSVKYAEIITNQSLRLAHLGNFSDAINYAEKAISIWEATSDTMNISFSRLLINTANYYTNRENYQVSIEKLERARTILREIEGESGLNYIECIGELSSAYNHIGDLQKADDLVEAVQNSMMAENDGTNTISKAHSLRKQAEIYFDNGNYKMASSLQNAALSIYKQYGDSLDMANTYDRLSNYYYYAGNDNRAIEYCQKAIDMYQRNGLRKTDMAQAYNSMSLYQYHAGNVDTALKLSDEALSLYAASNDTTSSLYAKVLSNAALYQYTKGNTDQALTNALHAYALQKEMLGEAHPDNVTCLFNIAHYYYKKGDSQKMRDYFHQAVQLQSNLVKKNFSHMTILGREKYWNTKKFVFTVAPVYAYLFSEQDSLLRDTYNAQLFTKGILLNSEIDFKKLLRQSGDANLLGKYMELERLKDQIADIYNKFSLDDGDNENRKWEVDALNQKATTLERDLMRSCKEYGDYTANMNLTAEHIGASLQEGEVAVELFEIEVDGGKAYYAMYLKKGWKVPRMVKMFNYHDLKNLQYNGKDFYSLIADREGTEYIFNEGRVGQMVWNPLIQSWGDDVQSVYFSPSGLFYRWGIEYLLMGDGIRIGDKYDIHRLSSTKLLVQRQKQRPITNAAIFGGLNYDLLPEDMAAIHEGLNHYIEEISTPVDEEDLAMERSVFEFESTVVDSLAVRGGVGFLPGALDEVKMIDEQLIRHGVSTDVFTEGEGIEESFKALDNQPYSIVHVATHGFSLDEHDESRSTLAAVLGGSWTASTNDASLHYSGLLFAGANNTLDNKKRRQLPDGKLPNGIENGILTSYEISKLDLGKIDMVVLSACGSGLGDIKEDGVFGLQRGFKKAGVQTLMMSLWNVNDRATQTMMTDFYQLLMERLPRHEAFKKAQERMRAKGFTAPYYWASFIMLDDI